MGTVNPNAAPIAVDRDSVEHYRWGGDCDGWRLLQQDGLGVTEERVPPGRAEVPHHHVHARQFFFVLSGTATLEFADTAVQFQAGQGVHVPPGVVHRFVNRSDDVVVFLVISSPSTVGDRVLAAGD